MSKYAITGSGGFIGSHLVKTLQERGEEVIQIPRAIITDYEGSLEQELAKQNPDYIIHLAAYGNMAHHDDIPEMIDVNIGTTYNLLEATRNLNYKGFVFVSSSSVLLPHETFYSATKAGAERICRAFADTYGKPITIVRPYSVYGPGEASYRFIPTVFRSCLEGEAMTLAPDAVHDWVYVEDFVNVLLRLKDQIAIHNVGTGVGTSNEQVVKRIEEITGKSANITETKQLRSFDNHKWVAKGYDWVAGDFPEGFNALDQGLQKYYEWYNNTKGGE